MTLSAQPSCAIILTALPAHHGKSQPAQAEAYGPRFASGCALGERHAYSEGSRTDRQEVDKVDRQACRELDVEVGGSKQKGVQEEASPLAQGACFEDDAGRRMWNEVCGSRLELQ